MRVFVSGATGLVGSHVVERLSADGHDVVALVRPSSDTTFLQEIEARIVTGDVRERESLVTAMSGCDAVVHSAAVIVAKRPWATYRDLNVGGTENVLNAAVDASVPRMLHVSSVAVYGGVEVASRAPVDEDDPLDLPLADAEYYARSKRAAEAVAWRFHRDGRLSLTIVRPGLAYGERDRVTVPRLIRALRAPMIPLAGSGQAELPLVYAGNLADAIVHALTSSAAIGRAFNVATDFPISQREFFGLFARELGLRRSFLPIPYRPLLGAAHLLELSSRMLSDRPPFLNRRNVSFMGGGNPFLSQRIRGMGWEATIPHVEGVVRTVRWYRSRKP